MKLCSDALAAKYIAAKEGRPCSARTVRAYRSREHDPLPATWSGRTYVFQSDEVDAWLQRDAQRQGPIEADRIKGKGYQLTTDQYNEMLVAQQGVCAICQQPPSGERLFVDHRHDNGRVRGLLCRSCNLKVSAFDSPLAPDLAAYARRGQDA